MITKNIDVRVMGILFVCWLPSAVFGQGTELRTAVTVIDSADHAAVVEFGVNPSATNCIDPALGEFELPPGGCTGSGLCLAFRDVHADSAACLGEGLLLDLRDYFSPAQADTYRIVYSFQNYPVVFRWSPLLGTSYDSARLIDELGGVLVNVDMLTADSVVMPSPLVSSLLIIAQGPKITSTSVSDLRQHPQSAHLDQNYPNPFNPATVLSYSLSVPDQVTLTVCTISGKVVATLVHRWQGPGTYSFVWNAHGQPSGIYYYRLQTGNRIATRSMLLVK